MAEEQPDYLGHRQRVRERFLKGEGRDMADYEVLELILMQAIVRRDVKPLAKKLIQTFGSLAKVISAPEHKLREIKGISDASVVALKLIKFAAQRLCWENLASNDLPVLLNVDNLIDYCRSVMAYAEVEELHIIYLDARLRILSCELLQKGSLTAVSASPREIVKSALDRNAAGIIMVHNHPSGSAKPSENDKQLTRMVAQACELMNIKLQEHLIISNADYFSFAEHNMLG